VTANPTAPETATESATGTATETAAETTAESGTGAVTETADETTAGPATGTATQTAAGGGRPGRTTLLVIAKEPVPGRVKTRLTPAYTPEQAARLAEAALADTLHALLAAPAGRRVLVLDGSPGRWLPPGYDVVPQSAGGLDERLAAAFARHPGRPALLVGMDTPQVTAEVLAPALAPGGWDGCDAWFGPALDGGFWALGLADPARAPELVAGVPMSTARTGELQRARLVRAGLRVRDLPPLRDVDDPADAVEVAAAAPGSRFAAALARCADGTGDVGGTGGVGGISGISCTGRIGGVAGAKAAR
jgi:glycosyltransferase A (GT-A) superfamily protein (DUF2064 family)